ncbi:MAG: hypothetical protein U1F48_15345 [Burkholderiales bacterium]
MQAATDDARRLAPLALWRYAHDYLRCAADLTRDHHTLCGESQVAYHLCAQGLEFALHAYLGACGMTADELRAHYRHALQASRAACEARGMAALPTDCDAAFAEVAACHHADGFRRLPRADDAPAAVGPLLDAGTWILAQAAPHVSRHYVEHLGSRGSPTAEEFVQRLRTALAVLRDAVRVP